MFGKYATFSGRARRSEYWWFFLFNVVVSVAASALDTFVIGNTAVEIVITLVLVLPGLAVSVRRLHDIDRSGWWLLIALIPLVGFIWLIVYQCRDSGSGPNEYGNSPKYSGDVGWPDYAAPA